ncbi:MAG: hypothetical protein IPH88_03745 [Bacteroidales bacterium]|nr:hypothetical protein [Bacteroidales bacterium]
MFIDTRALQQINIIDSNYVQKLIDSIFYNSLTDYLQNLHLHNYTLEVTANKLIRYHYRGFT